MSYLSNFTSNLEYGVVKVGNNIFFEDGVISVPEIQAGQGIQLQSNSTQIIVSATGADYIATYGTTISYNATMYDEYIGVSSTNAVTISLPFGQNGRIYYIKDEYGQGSGKITIQPKPGELIDGKTNHVISVPYQCVSPVFRAGQWRII